MNLWNRVKVTVAVENRLVGGIPRKPEMIEGWLKSNMPKITDAERESLKATTLTELPKAVEDKAEGMWTTFKEDDDGIYLEGRQIKAAFKESANILRDLLQVNESKKDTKKSRYTALRAKLAERLFIEEERIRMTRGGDVVKAPDGFVERPIHVMTAMGERTALKRTDYVESPTVTFHLRLLKDGVIDLELVKTLLDHMAWNGLGTDRSQGNGKFQTVGVECID